MTTRPDIKTPLVDAMMYAEKWEQHCRFAEFARRLERDRARLKEALVELERQIDEFAIKHGEADFYTGDARSVLSSLECDDGTDKERA